MPLLSHIQLVFALSFGLRPDLTAPRSGGLPSGARPMVDGVVIGIANQWLPGSGYFGLVIPSHGGRPGVASTWKEWVVHPQKKKSGWWKLPPPLPSCCRAAPLAPAVR